MGLEGWRWPRRVQCLDSLDSRNQGGYRSPGVSNELRIGLRVIERATDVTSEALK